MFRAIPEQPVNQHCDVFFDAETADVAMKQAQEWLEELIYSGSYPFGNYQYDIDLQIIDDQENVLSSASIVYDFDKVNQ